VIDYSLKPFSKIGEGWQVDRRLLAAWCKANMK
jgi:hypothetical protein